MKQILPYFLLCLLFLTLIIYRQWPDDQLHIVTCDVGQGDAILITKGFWQMLIDGGPNDSVLSCLNKKMPFWDRSIEVVVVTHADKDHIGGLPQVFANYRVANTYISDFKETEIYQKLFEALKDEQHKGMRLKTAFLGQKISLSQHLQIKILYPTPNFSYVKNMQLVLGTETYLSDRLAENIEKNEDSNDRSIGIYMQYKHLEVLLLGDLSKKGEIALKQKGMINKIEILKVGHHGAKTSSDWSFLRTAQPEISLISCGLNNKHGHPSWETMRKLRQLPSAIFDTSEDGTIELISDGEVVKVQLQN
ncbi:MAG: hypothetical protein U9O78_02085 [Patescibacteria group bacterium]|nr:hypothetical protein [Patescibacteria group bacterium]